MMRHCLWLVLWLAMLAVPAAAQTIYKCETVDGPVYSQQPCARPGGKMQKLTLPPEHVPDAGDLARGAASERASDEQLRQRQLVRQEAACIDAMSSATFDGTAQRIRGYRQQIAALQEQLRYASYSLADATRENGVRQSIAALESSINNEKNIAAQTELNARSICAQRRAQADAAGQQGD